MGRFRSLNGKYSFKYLFTLYKPKLSNVSFMQKKIIQNQTNNQGLGISNLKNISAGL